MTPAPERDRSGEQARGSGPRECLLSTHEREGEHTVTCPDARGSPFEERTRLAGNTLHVAAGDVTSGRNPPSLRGGDPDRPDGALTGNLRAAERVLATVERRRSR